MTPFVEQAYLRPWKDASCQPQCPLPYPGSIIYMYAAQTQPSPHQCEEVHTFFWLQMIKNSPLKLTTKFVQYEQSSKCMGTRDSSVSYASGVVTQDE